MNDLNATPPPVLDGARVLAYAVIDGSVAYTGRSTLHVDGNALGAVPRLAICQSLDNEETLLFFCDEQWNSLGVTSHSSLKDAQERAEREYRGVSAKWVNVSVSKKDAERYMAQAMRCSFCGKRPEQVEQMFQSQVACICNECVMALNKNVSQPPEKKKKRKSAKNKKRSAKRAK